MAPPPRGTILVEIFKYVTYSVQISSPCTHFLRARTCNRRGRHVQPVVYKSFVHSPSSCTYVQPKGTPRATEGDEICNTFFVHVRATVRALTFGATCNRRGRDATCTYLYPLRRKLCFCNATAFRKCWLRKRARTCKTPPYKRASSQKSRTSRTRTSELFTPKGCSTFGVEKHSRNVQAL